MKNINYLKLFLNLNLIIYLLNKKNRLLIYKINMKLILN